jgi:succinate-semialdehyde dehydrogenase/glutarate-semialdehyde dehydrogenase
VKRRVAPAAFVSINPATGRRLRAYRAHSPAEVAVRLRRARAAFVAWRDWPLADRAAHLRAVARALRRRRAALAALLTAEMGKPLAQALAEIEKSAAACDYYARNARRLLAPPRLVGAPPRARVAVEPLGTVLAIMPWNFPFWQVIRAAAPALMAGNTLLLKPAPTVTGCARALAAIFAEAAGRRAGQPAPGAILQLLLIPTAAVPAVIADARVQAVTLTGSTAAGRRVAALAGAAMKPGVFELGGSDAYLILADADLDRAAEVCAEARLLNSGQSCVAAKRFIVVRAVRRDFERRFAARLAARQVGDPLDPASAVGPLARRDLRDQLDRQVRASLRAGARLLLGGRPLPGPGFYYATTLLTDVARGMPAYGEELFGPVAAVIPVRDEAEAIAVANDSVYGLGAAVFSRNRRRARAVAARLEAGMVFVNDAVRSDPSLPFGGIRQSGLGRELGAPGALAFVNLKTLVG